MVSLYYIIALVTVLPICMLVIYLKNSNDDNNSNHKDIWTVFGFFVIMAFFLYSSYSSSSESSIYDPPLSEGYKQEHVQKIEDNSMNKSVFESKGLKYIAEITYVGFTAFLPAVFYLLFIISCDDKKPEPFRALLLAVFLGSLIAIVASYVGYTLHRCGLFSEIKNNIAESITIGYRRIAIPSEIIKWLFLLLFLRINKYYDEYVDGVVYSVCLAMGFACVLCVGYVFGFIGSPISTFIIQGLITALIIIPLNIMVGAIMGYFVALTKYRDKFLNYAFSLIIPIIISGFIYSIVAWLGNNWWYYFIVCILLTPLSGLVYYQIWHLMSIEKKERNNNTGNINR